MRELIQKFDAMRNLMEKDSCLNPVKAMNYQINVEDLLSIITDHDTFAAAGHARLAVHSNAVMKLFILHDYLSIFDPGSPGHRVPMLARVFALLSAINAPETYATGRSVAICALGDGGDS